jgi:hypothetical protein
MELARNGGTLKPMLIFYLKVDGYGHANPLLTHLSRQSLISEVWSLPEEKGGTKNGTESKNLSGGTI